MDIMAAGPVSRVKRTAADGCARHHGTSDLVLEPGVDSRFMLAQMTRLASLLALAVLAACTTETASPAAPTPVQAPASAVAGDAMVDLSTSIDPLRTSFNAHRGEARFLTLLSPS